MNKHKFCILFIGILLTAGAVLCADVPLNLLQTGDFKPVKMHGRTTAAYGWFMIDWPRFYHMRAKSYVPGDQCFTFECVDNAAEFRFPTPLHPIHANSKKAILFASRIGWPVPPAPEYRAVGKYMISKGSIMLGGRTLKPSDKWQSFDFRTKGAFSGMNIYPAPGAVMRLSELGSYAVYPNVGGSIALPDGGKLTKFILKKDAKYLSRWGVGLWRGWFWKLTGTALPVELADESVPTENAFVVTIEPELKRGWKLRVDKSGIVLTVSNEFDIVPALFDYLRRSLNCTFYTNDCQKIPPQGSVKSLGAVDYKVTPKYGTITGDDSTHFINGGRHLPLFSSLNDVNYYHLPNTQNDHVFNVIMPMDIYLKDHPEYFMMDANGRRVGHRDPCRTNPCFSNPEGVKEIMKNLMDYAKNQSIPNILTFETGDASTHCLCPECIKFNGGRTSNTESQFAFANKFAPLLAKERPDMKLVRLAYASRHTLPERNKPAHDNIIFSYCAGEELVPCTLHVDCEINRKGLKEIRAWGNMAEKPELMGYMTYSDIRPLQFVRRMAEYSKWGNAYIYMYKWRGYSPAVSFVINRWNLGENAEDALKEFDYYYYGKGGKFIHEINLLVDKFCSSYKHTAEEIKQNKSASYPQGIWCGNEQVQTRLDRKTLDKIYKLFDQALAAVGNDKVYRKRIIYEKSLYLIEDLVRWNRSSCRNQAELNSFARRLAEYVRMAREFPAMFSKIFVAPPPRELMQNITGVSISSTVPFWANEPFFSNLLKSPENVFRAGADIFPGGWYFSAYAMDSESPAVRFFDRCTPRYARVLNKDIAVSFNLQEKPSAQITLCIEGLADKKFKNQPIKVMINNRCFYSGASLFSADEWDRMSFSISAEFFKSGENVISLQPVNAASKTLRIAEFTVLDHTRDFANLAQGAKDTMWSVPKAGKDKKITAGNGKVNFMSTTRGLLSISFFRHHHLPKIGVRPGARIKMTIRASGRGNMQLGFSGYYAYQRKANGVQKIKEIGYQTGMYSRPYRSRHLRLSPQVREYTEVITCEKTTGMIFPTIMLDGIGNVDVYSFKIEILPPDKK